MPIRSGRRARSVVLKAANIKGINPGGDLRSGLVPYRDSGLLDMVLSLG